MQALQAGFHYRVAHGGLDPSDSLIEDEVKMAAGEKVDLESAVRLYYKRVYYFSLHLARNPDDAADLTQFAYEKLAHKVHGISDPSKVKSWLHTTVYRKFIDMRRRSTRFPVVELEEEQLPPEQSTGREEQQIDAALAVKALHQLEDDLRAPLSLFYLEGYSYKEIASTLELPVGTVMSRLYRGKKKLYQSLTGELT